MERVYLAFSIENWVTVTIIAFGSYLAFAVLSQLWRNYAKPAG